MGQPTSWLGANNSHRKSFGAFRSAVHYMKFCVCCTADAFSIYKGRRYMLQVDELLELSEMPSWSEISLKLYRDFANKYLIPTCFWYYLANGKVLEIHFTEWGIYHMLGIQHHFTTFS